MPLIRRTWLGSAKTGKSKIRSEVLGDTYTGGIKNNLRAENRSRRLNARVNTVRLGARTLEKKTIIIKNFSPPPKKNVEPVCPMDDVHLLV